MRERRGVKCVVHSEKPRHGGGALPVSNNVIAKITCRDGLALLTALLTALTGLLPALLAALTRILRLLTGLLLPTLLATLVRVVLLMLRILVLVTH